MAQIRLSNPSQTFLIVMLNYAMVIVLASTMAYWFWVFFKPSPMADLPASSPAIQSIVPTIQAGHWFSSSPQPSKVIAPTLNLKLVGVFSSTPKRPGFAIFKSDDGKQKYVVVNQELAAGTTLVAVHAHSVTIMQNGQASELKLLGFEG